MNATCNLCGGYGVTVRTDFKAKIACEQCAGRGFVEVDPWEEWEPMPETLAMLDGMTGAPHVASSRENPPS